MQVAGLLSALMAMIVTVGLGFLLEPLPRVILTCLMSGSRTGNVSVIQIYSILDKD